MITVRRSADRGHFDHGWLDTYHTFSFADYYDPKFLGFRSLRVINEDRVRGGMGFGTHGHRDMEIVTYVLDGELEHRDSMGNGSIIGPGKVQRMTAGTGVRHSEFNPSPSAPVHLLQIWIVPEKEGLTPGYEERIFPNAGSGFTLIASRDGRDNSLTIHQDAEIWAALLAGGQTSKELAPGRGGWLQVARGAVTLNGQELNAGDGAAITGEAAVSVSGTGEVILFDLA